MHQGSFWWNNSWHASSSRHHASLEETWILGRNPTCSHSVAPWQALFPGAACISPLSTPRVKHPWGCVCFYINCASLQAGHLRRLLNRRRSAAHGSTWQGLVDFSLHLGIASMWVFTTRWAAALLMLRACKHNSFISDTFFFFFFAFVSRQMFHRKDRNPHPMNLLTQSETT